MVQTEIFANNEDALDGENYKTSPVKTRNDLMSQTAEQTRVNSLEKLVIKQEEAVELPDWIKNPFKIVPSVQEEQEEDEQNQTQEIGYQNLENNLSRMKSKGKIIRTTRSGVRTAVNRSNMTSTKNSV